MSKVNATAQRAPSGQGIGFLITVGSSARDGSYETPGWAGTPHPRPGRSYRGPGPAGNRAARARVIEVPDGRAMSGREEERHEPQDSGQYYHEVLKRIPPRDLPAFEDEAMQERVWGRRWGVYNDVGPAARRCSSTGRATRSGS